MRRLRSVLRYLQALHTTWGKKHNFRCLALLQAHHGQLTLIYLDSYSLRALFVSQVIRWIWITGRSFLIFLEFSIILDIFCRFKPRWLLWKKVKGFSLLDSTVTLSGCAHGFPVDEKNLFSLIFPPFLVTFDNSNRSINRNFSSVPSILNYRTSALCLRVASGAFVSGSRKSLDNKTDRNGLDSGKKFSFVNLKFSRARKCVCYFKF